MRNITGVWQTIFRSLCSRNDSAHSPDRNRYLFLTSHTATDAANGVKKGAAFQ